VYVREQAKHVSVLLTLVGRHVSLLTIYPSMSNKGRAVDERDGVWPSPQVGVEEFSPSN